MKDMVRAAFQLQDKRPAASGAPVYNPKTRRLLEPEAEPVAEIVSQLPE